MFTEVKKHLKLIGKYFAFNLSALVEYRASFLIQVFGMALNNAAFAFFWWVLFDKIGMDIAGYGFADVMFLWAVVSTSYGIANILFCNARRISQLVITGELDMYLLQPKNPLVNAMSARMSASAWGDLGYGIVLLLILGVPLQTWLIFALACVTGALLMTAITITGHSLTLFFGNMEAFGNMLWEFSISFSIYPEGIFKGAVKALIMTVVPIGFITHVPMRLVQSFSWGTFALLISVTLAYCCFAFFLFMRGLKRYESGNLIITRM